jgi:hypothetical protein
VKTAEVNHQEGPSRGCLISSEGRGSGRDRGHRFDPL